MKILILANNDVGLYKFRKELIKELLKKHKVFISLPRGGYIKEFIDMGCEFIETSLNRRGTNPVSDLKLFKKYKNIIKNIEPNLVLTYTIKPNIYGGFACRIANVPYISNITGLGTAVENKGLLQKITTNLYKIALRKANMVFFQNEENMKFFLESNIVSQKYNLLPGSGVNIEEYKALEYPDNNNEINFLFVARVMKEKGIEEYIKTAKYFNQKNKHIKFHVVGDCEEEYEDILADLHEKNIITYHGLKTNVVEYYSKASCVIHPTYYPEGMSNVLLEASACGRAIITTNRSGCREIVDDNINGLIVESKNSKDLIKKTEEFISYSDTKKKLMGLMGRKKIETEFNRKIVIELYLKEINNIFSEI